MTIYYIYTESLKKKFNPMTITILSAKNLPYQPFLSYEQLQDECLPAYPPRYANLCMLLYYHTYYALSADRYATYKFFEKVQVSTPSVPQQQNIKWHHTKTFLVGLYLSLWHLKT